jgi:hypothetical protein
MKPGSRETLLIAVAKARQWVRGLERGQTFAEIAASEGKAERHIRHLVRLAFVSPRVITAIIDGTAPAGITATKMAVGLSHSWAEQEQRMSAHETRARGGLAFVTGRTTRCPDPAEVGARGTADHGK